MKPTTTNCHGCWAENRIETPATWVKDDEFYCDAHFRAEGLDPMQCVAIEKWRADHGLAPTEPVRRVRDGVKNHADQRSAERENEAMPRGVPTTSGRLCSAGCGRRLRKDSVGDECAKCRQNAHHGASVAMGTAKTKKAKRVKSPRWIGARARALVASNAAARRHVRAVVNQVVSESSTVSVELRVAPGWLDIAWARLSLDQKSRALAVVLAE